MENRKSHIGVVLEKNLTGAELSIKAYERISMKLNPLADAYEYIGLGDFSKDVLYDIFHYKTQNIQKKLIQQVEAEIKSTGIKLPALVESHKENALKSLYPFAEMVKKFIALYELEASRDRVSLNIFESVSNNGRLVIDKKFIQKVKSQFEIKIETEEQSDLYDRFLELKKCFESFMKVAKGFTVIEKEVDYWSSDSITFIDSNGNLNLNPLIIQELNSNSTK